MNDAENLMLQNGRFVVPIQVCVIQSGQSLAFIQSIGVSEESKVDLINANRRMLVMGLG